jgi:RNA polymerase sigma-70 factor (ECF subfamily)
MGDQEERSTAVEGAYRDHAQDLYRLAFGILRDQDAATDATQVAFARAYERWDQYDATRPVLPWLLRIVAHEALDSLRRRRVRWITAIAVAEREAGGRRTADFDLAATIAERSALDAALAQLKPIARAAILLRHLYGYDYAEIGQLLGTSPGNVGALLSRAHATLRQLLSEGELTSEPPGTRTTSTTRLEEPR